MFQFIKMSVCSWCSSKILKKILECNLIPVKFNVIMFMYLLNLYLRCTVDN